MKRTILVLCIMLGSGLLALGVIAPDFNGNWIRDASKSDVLGTYVDGKVQTINVNLVVRQQGNTLQVESIWDNKPSTKVNYILDGDTHTFTDERGGTLTYRTTLVQDHLVIEGNQRTNTPFGTAEVKTKEEWSLSSDQKTLTISTTTSSERFGSQSRKQVYTR